MLLCCFVTNTQWYKDIVCNIKKNIFYFTMGLLFSRRRRIIPIRKIIAAREFHEQRHKILRDIMNNTNRPRVIEPTLTVASAQDIKVYCS